MLLKLVQNNFAAAGLNPKNAGVYIVNDDSINAFVAGGQTIFIHSGLITHAKGIDDVAFVLSHETGHIVGGHVVRGITQMKNAQTTALISTVLGGLLAVASGRPDAGLAIMMGGSGSAMGSYLSYRQTEESAADRIAVDIMKKTGYSMIGFTNTMKQLQAEERLNANPDAYLSTHPMTRERMRDIERFTQNTKPVKQDLSFELIKAKLTGFLNTPEQTRLIYKGSTLADSYAQAIAAYRDNQIADSLKQIDALIKRAPQNPYFYELKGQFLFETGNITQSVKAYEKAVSLLPKAPLIRLVLGQALVESDQSDDIQKAIKHLSTVTAQDGSIPGAWRLLAIAYGKAGDIPMADYAMAEYYVRAGQISEAHRLAKRAADKVTPNTPAARHIQDILALSGDKK